MGFEQKSNRLGGGPDEEKDMLKSEESKSQREVISVKPSPRTAVKRKKLEVPRIKEKEKNGGYLVR